MSNMIAAAKEQIDALVVAAYEACAAEGTLPAGIAVETTVEIPKDARFGDYASNFAMAAARGMHMAPRKIADALLEKLDLEGSYFSDCSVAGAGFLNFTLADRWYGEVLATVEREGAAFARSDAGRGEKVIVEFVSANPTGPMHMGNARGGVLGDTLASVLDASGYDVWRV